MVQIMDKKNNDDEYEVYDEDDEEINEIIKETVIARIKQMPDNIKIAIG